MTTPQTETPQIPTHRLIIGVALIIEHCQTCGVIYGVTGEFMAILRDTKADFYCPNGHCHAFEEPEDTSLSDTLHRDAQAIADGRSVRELQQGIIQALHRAEQAEAKAAEAAAAPAAPPSPAPAPPAPPTPQPPAAPEPPAEYPCRWCERKFKSPVGRNIHCATCCKRNKGVQP